MRERATTAFCVRKLVCFHRMPSSCSWQQTTLGSLTGEPLESLCHASKYLMVPANGHVSGQQYHLDRLML
jgi:hypothetical protein